MQNTDLIVRGFSIDWSIIPADSYLQSIPSVRTLDTLRFHSPITFFSGENGSGKSTLLEALAIAAGFNPEGGSKNYRFSTRDSHSELYQALRLVKSPHFCSWGYFLRAESFYNVATMDEAYADDPSQSIHAHERSHGEGFLELIRERFQTRGLYILDEPEAALSPQRQLTLMALIHQCVLEGSQFIIATHSPILLGFPEAEILCFDGELHPVSYEETESYQITSLFLQERERLLYQLFRENEA